MNERTKEGREAAEDPEADDAETGDGREERGSPGETRNGEGMPAPASTVKASLLWGVIGGLSFLVLIQGYELLTDQGVALAVKFGVAALVAVLAGVSTYTLQERLQAENESA